VNISKVNHALQRIARGAGIVFVGTIISMLFVFGFFSVVLIARTFSKAEYGVFSFDDFERCICSCNDGISEFSERDSILQGENAR